MDKIFYFDQLTVYLIQEKFYICDSLLKTKPRGVLIEITGDLNEGVNQNVYIYKLKAYKNLNIRTTIIKKTIECEDGFIENIQLLEKIKNKYFIDTAFVLNECEAFKFYKIMKKESKKKSSQ